MGDCVDLPQVVGSYYKLQLGSASASHHEASQWHLSRWSLCGSPTGICSDYNL